MKVRELLSAPEAWTKGYYANDKDGGMVYPESEEAVCWCLSGAINRCYSGLSDRRFAEAKLEASIRELFPNLKVHQHDSLIVAFNDHKATYGDIRKVVEHADI
jgi:hypothetical protein